MNKLGKITTTTLIAGLLITGVSACSTSTSATTKTESSATTAPAAYVVEGQIIHGDNTVSAVDISDGQKIQLVAPTDALYFVVEDAEKWAGTVEVVSATNAGSEVVHFLNAGTNESGQKTLPTAVAVSPGTVNVVFANSTTGKKVSFQIVVG